MLCASDIDSWLQKTLAIAVSVDGRLTDRSDLRCLPAHIPNCFGQSIAPHIINIVRQVREY